MQNLSINVHQTFAQTINQADDLHTLLTQVLSIFCELADWDYGEVWIPDQEGRVLEPHPASYINRSRGAAEVNALEQFRSCTKGLTFARDVGLPGRVWSSQQAEWLSDPASQSERIFLRHHIAKAFGIKAGFGVPVVTGDRLLAVFAFFMVTPQAEDRALTELVVNMADLIGSKLQALLNNELAHSSHVDCQSGHFSSCQP